MRRDELYLRGIVEASDAVAGFLVGISREEFLQNDLLRSAVLQKLMIMGEAAAHVNDTIRDKYPQVPWRRIVSFRNYAVHEYFGVNWGYAWVAATEDVALLRERVQAVLRAEFGVRNAMSGLTWDDPEGVALALLEKHPGIDPLTVRFTDLHRWVMELADFCGDAASSSEGKLEAIQMAWWEEWDEEGP